MKYPILLVHGMGIRDDKKIGYWGRIPKALVASGFDVILSGQDCDGSIESNARQVASKLDEVLLKYNTDKVNIIAHSKGGLEARYLASSMGYDGKIASITTISSPHHGSKTVDFLMQVPDSIIRFACKITDWWFGMIGDKEPDTYSAICAFRTPDAALFNSQNPDSDNIYYQSYGFKMKNCSSDFLMWITNVVVNHFDGANDGLLSPDSTRWTNFKPVVTGYKNRGVSHCDEVDMRRSKVLVNTEEGVVDIKDLYVNIAKGLEEKGY